MKSFLNCAREAARLQKIDVLCSQIDGREQVRFFHAMPHNPPGLAGNRQP
jgi:hypothetical protein